MNPSPHKISRPNIKYFITFLDRPKAGVLISHRFSTVRMADRILRSELAEIGTHEELLAKESRYAELFNLQAAGYQ